MESTDDLDVLIIGAGINGLYTLHVLRSAGLQVRAVETGPEVGGTWYWNRYPGAALDSESYIYASHFSSEVNEEWQWTDEFADQATMERHLKFVADRLDLRRSIEFETEVTSCIWQTEARTWRVETNKRTYQATFVVAATGILSVPVLPEYDGLTDFQGRILHTAQWPRGGVDLAGESVAVMGVGSTGIQVIQSLAPVVDHLTVLQRTPNWATPMNNRPLTSERQQEIRETHAELYRATMATSKCFLGDMRSERTMEVSAEDRERYFDHLYQKPGLTFFTENFQDVFVDKEANDALCDFLRRKIEERVKDPATARRLVPEHHFGMKRPPLETNYYEVFNQVNVDLVALTDEPIVRFGPFGVETERRSIPLDTLVLATGFDAVTGSFLRLGVRGSDGRALSEWWNDGPRTFMGCTVSGFPNWFIVGGPQGTSGNNPRCAHYVSDWIRDLIIFMRKMGHQTVDTAEASESDWVDHCNELVMMTLLRDAESWQWGSNVPGKKRAFLQYLDSQVEYRRKLDTVTEGEYRELIFE